jgi:hypothetical protein
VFGQVRLPVRFAPFVMALQLSIVMTMVVSGVSTFRGIGLSEAFLHVWLSSWFMSWIVAFPTLLILMPAVRALTARLCRR